MITYLTITEVLAIHQDQIRHYGGATGLRDAGLLQAAVLRPQNGYYTSLLEQAAALWESLSQNHPFVDGNKRTAFACTYTFLAINDLKITANAMTIEVFVLRLYQTNTFRFSDLLHWLEQNTGQIN